MIQRISNHVHQRVGQFFDDRAVEFDFAADRFQFDPLSELAREIAHQPRHAAEQRPDRHQPHRHGRLLQLRRDPRQLRRSCVAVAGS